MTLWLIRESGLDQPLMSIALMGNEGRKELFAMLGEEQPETPYQVVNGSALIEVSGPLMDRPGWLKWFGFTGYEDIRKSITLAEEDPGVNQIVFVLRSPGGTVAGAQSTVNAIREAKKSTVGVIQTMACSACYWLASACDELYAEVATVESGSIGVVQTHFDYSALYSDIGIKVTHVHSGDLKVVGTPYKELSEADKAVLQAESDAIMDIFAADVAAFRGLTIQKVKSFQAGVFLASEATLNGLLDGIKTLNDVTSKEMAVSSATMEDSFEKVKAEAFQAGFEARSQEIAKIAGLAKHGGDPAVILTCINQGKDFESSVPLILESAGASSHAIGEEASVPTSAESSDFKVEVIKPKAQASSKKPQNEEEFKQCTSLVNEFGDFETYQLSQKRK